MIRTQIQVHPKQMKWLKKHALEKGISMAQAIRDSVDFYRFHLETTETAQSKRNKALRVIGSFSTDTVKSN
jgi:hypothetical protein